MTQGKQREKKPILKKPADRATRARGDLTNTHISSSTLCFRSAAALFPHSAEIRMSLWGLWISRWQPITVILSVSVSSAVLTQLPEDGEPAWFNHPLTLGVMITHIARRQVEAWWIVTALLLHSGTYWHLNHRHHDWIPRWPAPQTSCCKHTPLLSMWTSPPDGQQAPAGNLKQLMCAGLTVNGSAKEVFNLLQEQLWVLFVQYKCGFEEW